MRPDSRSRMNILGAWRLRESRLAHNSKKVLGQWMNERVCEAAAGDQPLSERVYRKRRTEILFQFSFCCLGRIRTLTGGTRIRRATITPQGNWCGVVSLLRLQSYALYFYRTNFLTTFLSILPKNVVRQWRVRVAGL